MSGRRVGAAVAGIVLAVFAVDAAPEAADRLELRPAWDAALVQSVRVDMRAPTIRLGTRRSAVLRFDLRRVTGRIARARLIVRVRGKRSSLWVSRARLRLERVSRTEMRGVRGRPLSRGFVSFDVTSRLRAGKQATLVLYRRGRGRTLVAARESGRATGPRLALVVRPPAGPPVAPAPPPPPPAPPPPPVEPPPPPEPSPVPVPDPTPAPTPTPETAIVAAAGDIADDSLSSLGDDATADVIGTIGPDAVLALGDLAYGSGTLFQFRTFYEPSWGRHKAITRPAPGNHEYQTSGAAGYYDYFNGEGVQTGVAADRSSGWYSFDLGNWHLVALNSNCDAVGGCGSGSPQEQWLRRDLAASTKPCTVAFWHHPRFASGGYSDDAKYVPFWRALHEFNAEVVLNGHDHNYQRYAPLDPDGRSDSSRGIRQFIVGTGGRDLRSVRPSASNREAANDDSLGVLKLTLAPDRYEWSFVPAAGGGYTDSGSGTCH